MARGEAPYAAWLRIESADFFLGRYQERENVAYTVQQTERTVCEGNNWLNIPQNQRNREKMSLATSVADPGSGAFFTRRSWMGEKSRSGSGMLIPDHIYESLETIVWVKNT